MSVSFEQYKAEGNEFLHHAQRELGTANPEQAGRIMRSILMAIRDRLPVNEAANFAQQLPMAWKGIFYDQFEPDKMPVKIRNAQEWIDFIRSKNEFAVSMDFPTDNHVVSAFNCILNVLYQRMSPGHLEKALNLFPKEITELVSNPTLKEAITVTEEV